MLIWSCLEVNFINLILGYRLKITSFRYLAIANWIVTRVLEFIKDAGQLKMKNIEAVVQLLYYISASRILRPSGSIVLLFWILKKFLGLTDEVSVEKVLGLWSRDRARLGQGAKVKKKIHTGNTYIKSQITYCIPSRETTNRKRPWWEIWQNKINACSFQRLFHASLTSCC